jgi:hypothetical protein
MLSAGGWHVVIVGDARMRGRDLLEHRHELAARTPPRRPVIDENRDMGLPTSVSEARPFGGVHLT